MALASGQDLDDNKATATTTTTRIRIRVRASKKRETDDHHQKSGPLERPTSLKLPGLDEQEVDEGILHTTSEGEGGRDGSSRLFRILAEEKEVVVKLELFLPYCCYRRRRR